MKTYKSVNVEVFEYAPLENRPSSLTTKPYVHKREILFVKFLYVSLKIMRMLL